MIALIYVHFFLNIALELLSLTQSGYCIYPHLVIVIVSMNMYVFYLWDYRVCYYKNGGIIIILI